MSAVAIDQRDFALPEGVLRLTSLSDDRLILAELAEGQVKRQELHAALDDAGFKHGLIEAGMNLLVANYSGQAPVARAEVVDLPAQTTDLGLDIPILEEVAASGRFEALERVDVSFPVTSGQPLASIEAPPRTVLRYPTGLERVLHDHEPIDPALFAGSNTEVGENGSLIVAGIDGLAHRTIYGTVMVHPIERAGGIGSAHGKLYKETALAVEQDISDGSQIETLSTLTVRGAVHGATIQAGGNIQIDFTVDNPTRKKEAKLLAGQSIRARSLQHVSVWAGGSVISLQGILNCTVECMDSLVTNTVAASKLSVGHRLIVGNVGRHSVIKLGTKFIQDPHLRARQVSRSSSRQRIHDLEQSLGQHRTAYDHTRKTLLRQIDRMREPTFAASQRQKATRALIRLFNDLDDTLGHYRKNFGEYKAAIFELAQDKVAMDYYGCRLEGFPAPYIIVTGTMDTGTQIQGPVDRQTLKKPLKNLRIGLHPHTGKLVTEPLAAAAGDQGT